MLLTNYQEGDREFIVKKIDEINQILKTSEGLPPISLSAGAAFSTGGYSDLLFKSADFALYDIKRNRKGRCKVYE